MLNDLSCGHDALDFEDEDEVTVTCRDGCRCSGSLSCPSPHAFIAGLIVVVGQIGWYFTYTFLPAFWDTRSAAGLYFLDTIQSLYLHLPAYILFNLYYLVRVRFHFCICHFLAFNSLSLSICIVTPLIRFTFLFHYICRWWCLPVASC